MFSDINDTPGDTPMDRYLDVQNEHAAIEEAQAEVERPKGLKTYLGDAVYIDFDGYQFIVTTEYSPSDVTHKIYFDRDVMDALLTYVNRVLAGLR